MAVSNTDTVFRKEVYDYLIHNLSSVMYEDDIDIFVTLICYVFGDLWQRARLLPWEIDFDHCDEEYLRGLSGNIGYKWNEALTADQQREAMKLYNEDKEQQYDHEHELTYDEAKEKIIDFIKSSKNPYMFKCNGKKVKIEFANTNLIAEDSLTKTLKNVYQ